MNVESLRVVTGHGLGDLGNGTFSFIGLVGDEYQRINDERTTREDKAREHPGAKGMFDKVLTEGDKGNRVKKKRIAGKCLFGMEENGMRSVCNEQRKRYRREGEVRQPVKCKLQA